MHSIPNHNQRQTSKLIDRFGRHINYVRLSVTDRCDLRCVYCMAENMTFLPRAKILTLEELAMLGQAFVELGVRKIRLTGGEPLVRRDVMQLFNALGCLPGLNLVLTTNGSRLDKFAQPLKAAGVKRLNISLDSLKPERFRRITRVGDLNTVMRGIQAARQAGFEHTKLNAVILKNRNHDEVVDLARFAIDNGLDISYIEEMPLGDIGDRDRAECYYSSDQILQDLEQHFTLVATTETTGGPSKYYRVPETDSKIGFISPHSHNFCGDCNRVRVTVEGRLLLCLGQEHSLDLRHVLRANPGDMDCLKQAIIRSMEIKPKGHDFNIQAKPIIMRHMNTTGG